MSYELYKARRFPESIDAAKKALVLDPKSDQAYNNICAAYNELKQWVKAIEACQRALDINPNSTLAKNNLRVAQTASLTTGKSYEDYINDSLTFYNAGDYQKSIEAAQGALQLQPNSAIAYNNLCSVYNQLKRWDKAIEACQRALPSPRISSWRRITWPRPNRG